MPRLTDFACCNLYIKTVQSSPRVRRDSLHLVFLMYFIFVFKNLNILFLQFFYVKKTYYTGSNANIIKMYIDKLTSNSILQPIYDTLTRYTCQINYQVESFKTLMQTDQTDTNKKRKHPSVANCNLQVQ